MLNDEYLEKLSRIMREGMIYKACLITGITEGLISIKIHEPQDEHEYNLLARGLQELITPASEVMKIYSWYPPETWSLLRKDNRLPEVMSLNKACNAFRKAWRGLPKIRNERKFRPKKPKEEIRDE